MAQLGRLLVRQCPALQHLCCSCVALNHLFFSTSLPLSTNPNPRRGSSPVINLATRGVHKLVRGLRPRDAPPAPSDLDGNSSGSDSESITYKSRNALKRDARRAVRWAMDLASFSTPQLKLIIRVASLDEDVLDAVMLVKRFGNDVREGKRRQYNYIAKLLRDADTELMDALIRATKDSDQKKLQDLCGSEALSIDDEEEEEAEESDNEEEEGSHIEVASRWVEGMINKDVDITNEVYSISDVEFDRQELRKLVRKVHLALERSSISEENKEKIDEAVVGAKKSLTRFLRALAKSSLMINL
ncbi:PREDICTED: uncharacterized protein LOC101304935 [Fragaria vesca subsp. vesca]|uniref:uncharacterized protein LOC101304935 n=1 Tax=Fragaria vesca subsp. vesca TaxID=101020 RepID=UPI0002C2DF54|nr:PREDICTED: uncharacterized protein LOC101304935 [Fragaria vesca subsp. vesca]